MLSFLLNSSHSQISCHPLVSIHYPFLICTHRCSSCHIRCHMLLHRLSKPILKNNNTSFAKSSVNFPPVCLHEAIQSTPTIPTVMCCCVSPSNLN
ncbi:hypothetical protein CW304_12430 [Bacillus sp. UFRGS-B20]|nr:hypothetical protein CW304_12430 [Bacillus sp. UFRGS-B20]